MRRFTCFLRCCVALLCVSVSANAQLTGVITVPSTIYPTLAAAVDSLNRQGVGAGGVTVTINANQTAPVGGYRLGSATLNASTSNLKKVIFNGNGSTVTGYVGTSTTTDGIFYIMGTDWVEINRLNLSESSANTTATTQMEWGYSLVKLSNTAPFDGVQNCLINNCTISLSGTNANSIAIRGAHSVAATTTVLTTTGATAASANSNNRFTSNTIRNITRGISMIGVNALAGYDRNNVYGGATAADGNTITVGGSTSTTYGIYTQYDSTVTYSNNVLSIATGQNGAVYLISPNTGIGDLTLTNNRMNVSCSMTTPYVYAYYNNQGHRDAGTGASSTSTHTLTGNFVSGNNPAATSSYLYGIYEYYASCQNLVMSNNTVRDVNWGTGTGYIYAIGHYYTYAPNITDNNNLVYNIEKQGTSGYLYLLYFYEPGSPAGTLMTVENNVVRNIKNRNLYVYPIYVYASSSATLPMPRIISRNNVVDSIDVSTATSTTYVRTYFGYYGGDNSIIERNRLSNVIGGSSSTYVYTYFGYTSSGRKNYAVKNNLVTDVSGTTLYSYNYLSYYATNIDSNEVRNISSTSGGTSYNYLAYYGDSVVCNNNYIHNINMGGTAAIYNYFGMYTDRLWAANNVIDSMSTQSGTMYNWYSSIEAPSYFRNNRLSRIFSNSTSNTIYGWYMGGTASGSYIAYNNVISDINVPAGYSNTNSVAMDAIGSMDYNLYNNTIRINPGVNAAFKGLEYGTGANLDLRNNIINVNADPTGTTGFTAALVRTSGTAGTRPANFLATSNGNIFYAPNVANSWLYAEGTAAASLDNTYNLSNDPSFNTPCGLFKTFMAHNFGSFTENNLVAGTTPFTYRPAGASFAERGAVPVPTAYAFTNDHDNITRGPVADIGALEFAGTATDNAPPVITYTAVPTQSYCVTNPRIVATITDVTGVNTTTGSAPRLYFRKANTNVNNADVFGVANNNTGNGWKWVEPTTISGNQYTFDFDYSLLQSPVVPGDSIKYFIIAQDVSPATNTGFNIAAFTTCPSGVNLGASNGPLLAQPDANGFRVLPTPVFDVDAYPSAACQSGSTVLTVIPTPYGTGVQWQSASLTGTFTNIAGATGQTYTTPVLTTTTRYRVLLTCGSTPLATSAIDTFVIANPAIVSVAGATICGYDSATISAVTSPFSTGKWYATATGGTALGSGNSFTTPQIRTTTTYYVSAVTSNASLEAVTAVKRVPAYTSTTTSGSMSFRFNNASTNFYSTTIYPWGATIGSTVTFELYDSAGYASGAGAPIRPAVTATLPFSGAGATPLVVNFPWRNIPAGRYTVAVTLGSGAQLCIDYPTSAPLQLPIVSPSGGAEVVGTEWGTNINTYYPYMWNNMVGADCESGSRVPVTVTVTTAPAIRASSPDSNGVCLGTAISLGVSSANTDYVYTWQPGGVTGSSFTATPAGSTSYTVRAVDPYTGCVAVDTVKINVNAQTAPPTIAPNPATICGGNPVQLTASLPAGINNMAQLGSSTNATTSGMPLYTSSTRYHAQYIVTRAELNALGMTGPTWIKSWGFDVASAGTVAANFTIRMGHAGSIVTQNRFGCSYPGGLQQVFTQATYLPTTGWNTHVFQSMFAWDGTSNIVIDVTFDKDPGCTSTSVTGTSSTVNYHSALTGSTLYYYHNTDCSVTGCSPSPYTSSLRPNMQFNFGAPSVINWLNVTGLYKNAAATTPMTLTDTLSTPYASPVTTTVYRAVVNTQGCLSLPSDPDTVYVIPAPNVTVTPAGPQTICGGQSVTLCVTPATNQTYQWYLNNNAISGANSNCLVATAAGTYKITITNIITGCSNTSVNIPVTVNAAPAVTVTQRGAASRICKGVTDTLIASGTGLVTYQWRNGGVNIPGATSSRLIVTGSGSYTVLVSNANNCTGTSAAVNITVDSTPTTITPLGPTTFCAGGNVTLQAPAAPAGSTFTYQWRMNGVAIAGATISSYTTGTTGNYTVLVTNTTTGCRDSSVATVVNAGSAPSSVITPNGNRAFCQGGNLVLNAVSQPGLSYQWYQNGNPIGGATNASYTATTAGSYTVQVSITATPTCNSTTAVPAVLSVNPLPTATATAAGPTTFCLGGNVVINANTGTGLAYQWILNGAPVSGQTASSITAAAGGNYRVAVINTATGCSDTSAPITVTTSPLPNTTITPGTSPTFCQGGNVNLCVPAGATSYTWNLNGTPIPGATTACYTANATGLYSVSVTGTNNCSATSAPTSVQVNPIPVVTTTPSGAANICQGNALTVTTTPDTNLNYQWQRNGVNISGATASSYAVGVAGTYTVIATNKVTGCTGTSAGVQVTVNTPPNAAVTITGASKVCQGDSVHITATTGVGYVYQWRRNGVNIAGATSDDYYAKQSGNYSVSITNASQCTTISNTATVTVDPRPAAYITYNTPLEFCEGSAVVLNGNPGAGLTYIWIKDGVPTGGTGIFYEASITGRYTLRVTNNAGCTSFADTLDVQVNPKPTPQIVRSGTTLGTSTPYASYQWFLNNRAIGGAFNATHDYTENGAYKVLVVDANGCEGESDLFFVNNVGIPNSAVGQAIRIYPNPTSRVLNIDASVKVKVALRDVAGKLILEASDVKQINLGDIAAGMYMIYISDMNGVLLRADKVTKTAN